MRSLFASICASEEDVEARCLLALSLFVGTRLIAAGHRGRSRAEVLARALRELLA